eukprot:COSAG03_NODE_9649_length_703_cov_1.192053_2_plen_60_part_01
MNAPTKTVLICGSRYREGHAPLPPQDSELLLGLNEDADWVMGTLANIGGGTGRSLSLSLS